MSQPDARKRYREIAGVLVRYGFDWLWASVGLGRLLGIRDGLHHDLAHSAKSQPERVRMALEDLGTTAVKLGQVVSTRPDILPPEYISELSKLQDHVQTVPFEQIKAEVEEEFAAPLDQVFASFSEQPRAAASIAQVHDAVLPDGTPVVVKVRRPGVADQVEQDLAVLGQVARLITTHFGPQIQIDLGDLVDEFGGTLREELDFTREAHNAQRIAVQFADDPSVHVPYVFEELSTRRVLTMERVEGIKVDDVKSLEAAGIDRSSLARQCAHIALVQVLEHGFFHADPHPGNFFVEPDGTVALIDYGMVGRISDKLKSALLRLGLAVSRQDTDMVVEELLNLGAARGPLDRDALAHDIRRILATYEGVNIGEVSADKIFRELTATAQKHSLQLPSELIVLARVVAMDEGLGAKLDPDFNLVAFARPYFERFWRQSHSLRATLERLRSDAVGMLDFASDLPKRAAKLTGMLERGEMKVNSRVEIDDSLIKDFHKTVNRLSVSVLTAGLIVGLSVLAQVFRPEGVEPVGFVVVKILLVVGVVAAGWLTYGFWKSSR